MRFALAQIGVLLAASDTYVVVLVLPVIMADIGLSIERLQQAAPIVSGFLLGYVAMLPVLGRLSDLYGRLPVLVGCLVTFGLGSFVTATSHGLGQVVVGRALQGLGGGGLVPVTLGLVADYWPPDRRGPPLGFVGAAQEGGSLVGPLFGAAVLALASWRWIFWVNLLCSGLLCALLARGHGKAGLPAKSKRFDWLGALLVLCFCALGTLLLVRPNALLQSTTIGAIYDPLLGTQTSSTSPLALAALVALASFVVWELKLPRGVRPLVELRGLPRLFKSIDWPGALLLSIVLGCIVISFATANPSQQVVAGAARWLLPLGAVAACGFVWRELATRSPLVDFRAFADRAATGALAVNLAIGAALIAAVVDVPIFARVTAFPDSQLQAALVLVRFLAAVPVGALLGGWLVSRASYRAICTGAMALSAAMFALMANWTQATLTASEPALIQPLSIRASDLVLVGCGLGFGTAIAPVNAAILGAVKASVHGLASALVVAARMIGMLCGLSLLTAIGLHSFYSAQARIPPPQVLCPQSPLHCSAYEQLTSGAVLDELRTIFIGACVCALCAAIIACATLRRHRTAASA